MICGLVASLYSQFGEGKSGGINKPIHFSKTQETRLGKRIILFIQQAHDFSKWFI